MQMEELNESNKNLEEKPSFTYFNDLFYVDVGDHIEKKKDLSYLSWSYAVAEIMKRFPDFSYNILTFENGLPYMLDEKTGYMVWTEVTIQGITRRMWLPVMDSSNKAMKDKPYTYKTKYGENTVEAATMFDINKTIMRCLVKNLAMFGLGLYIYAGEDLPEESEEEKQRKETERKKRESELAEVINAIRVNVADLIKNGVPKDDVSKHIKSVCVVNGKPSANYTKITDLKTAKKVFESVCELNANSKKE